MTTRAKERAVVRAAVALCAAGNGFCFKDVEFHNQISSTVIGRRLEEAVARLASRAARKGRK